MGALDISRLIIPLAMIIGIIWALLTGWVWIAGIIFVFWIIFK
jgi:hypothetical protein